MRTTQDHFPKDSDSVIWSGPGNLHAGGPHSTHGEREPQKEEDSRGRHSQFGIVTFVA